MPAFDGNNMPAARGDPGADRAFRQRRFHAPPPQQSIETSTTIATSPPSVQTPFAHPRRQSGSITVPGALFAPSPVSAQLALSPVTPLPCPLGWESLPPYDEVVEGVQCLATSFFQLGFLAKTLFFERLRKDRDSVSIFLLCSILSVSARFTPSLVKRYHGGTNATRAFLDMASCFAPTQMFTSTLDSIQGFFLMSIAEWGNGDQNRSLVYMGIAIRLAGILRMHREETYRLPEKATSEEIVYSEVARRTFWMLETFENLHSGSDSPIAFSYDDITALLPCDERDFAFGVRPQQRAALLGTPPATHDPKLTKLPTRSLFATLLQTHSLWGQVARLVSAEAMQFGDGVESRISVDDYGNLSQALMNFESDLPQQHCWSDWNLRGFKVEGLDLAYLSVVMVLRLSNIILRRNYLHFILSSRRDTDSTSSSSEQSIATEAWSPVADQLFDNMLMLHEQINAFFEHRSPDQGYPALIVFCIYVCGSLAVHLHRQPQLCPRAAPQAVEILRTSMGGLVNLQAAWPFARRWYLALSQASEHILLEDSANRLTEQSINDAGSGTRMEASIGPALPMEVQFNDPLPTESMFEAFDMYSWDAVVPVGGAWGG
ncbi:uncharacterized protein E0L32_004298 [Thyridium curvatum]|uniref:Xylanolytic transcriptional activator regulatory domain-containing protein n=1 Tax=Thyridium curvatum TaxID=1093900 RepID=A0A507BGC3_9PEZI|nr:uncharacterized protein E0L32_004298 [Thyridium curvatum]TPX15600.1 hypothetical protein E0L32_004298 [Thyridium curvatum]